MADATVNIYTVMGGDGPQKASQYTKTAAEAVVINERLTKSFKSVNAEAARYRQEQGIPLGPGMKPPRGPGGGDPPPPGFFKDLARQMAMGVQHAFRKATEEEESRQRPGGGGRQSRGVFFGGSTGGRLTRTVLAGPSGQAGGRLAQIGIGMDVAGARLGGAAGMGLAGVGLGVAAFATLGAAASTAAKGINTLGDETMTAGQRTRAFRESLPLIGNIFRGFRELNQAMTGFADTMRRIGDRADDMMTLRQAQAVGALQLGGAQREVDTASARAAAARIPYDVERRFDRGTFTGRVAAAEQRMTEPARDERVRAQREAVATAQDATIQETRTKAAREDVRRAGLALNAAEKEQLKAIRAQERGGAGQTTGPPVAPRSSFSRFFLGTLGFLGDRGARDTLNVQNAMAARGGAGVQPGEDLGVQRNRADTALTQANRDLAAAQTAAVREEAALVEKANAAKRAGAGFRQAELNVQKAQLEVLRSQEERMSSQQRRLGAMTAGEYERAKAAAMYIKEFGTAGATREILDQARLVAPEHLGNIEEKAGAGRAQEFARAGFDDYQSTRGKILEEVRKQVDAIPANIKVQVQLNEEKLAQDIAKILMDAVKVLKADLDKEAAGIARENVLNRNQQRERNNQEANQR